MPVWIWEVAGEMERTGFKFGRAGGWRAVGAQEEADEEGDEHMFGQVGLEGSVQGRQQGSRHGFVS